MKKEIRFSAKLDTQEFDRTVEALQGKIKDVYRGSETSRLSYQNKERMGALGIGPAPTAADRARVEQSETKSRRELDRFIKEQVKDQEKLTKSINNQVEEMKKLVKEQKTLREESEKYKKIQEDLSSIQKKISQERSQVAAKDEAISAALGRRETLTPTGTERLARAYMGGGARGALTAGGRMLNQAWQTNPASLIGAAFGAAGTAAYTGGQLVGGYMQLPYQTTQGLGSAASVYNREMERSLRGGAYENAFYAQERQRAKKEAETAVKGQRVKDVTGIAGSALGYGAAGAGIGALTLGALGGIAGSVVPGAGTYVGAVGGAKLGAWLGGGIGTVAGLGSQGTEVLGQAGIGRWGEATRARYLAQEAQAYEAGIELQKQLNPVKKLALEDFERNAAANLSLQRAFGLSDEDLSSFYGGITGAGFTRESGRGMAQGILAAGGSTRGARETAGFGLKMQRDYGLTNSAQVLGRLTGVSGSGAAAEKSLAGIFAASVKEGLDKSEFRAENRKFTESVSEIVYRAGASDPMAAAMIAERQRSFIADKSGRGMEAAVTASQFMSGLEKQTMGVGGVLQMGGMLSDENLSRMDPFSMTYLMGLDENQIASLTKEQKDYYAKQANVKSFEKDLMPKIAQVKDVATMGGVPGLFESVQKARKLSEVIGPLSFQEQQSLEEQRSKIIERVSSAYPQLDQPAIQSVTEGLIKGKAFDTTSLKKAVDEQEAKMKASPEGKKRVVDVIEEQAAGMDKVMNVLQQQFTPEIGKAADEVKKLTQNIGPLIDALNAAKKAAEEGKKEEAVSLGKKISEQISVLWPSETQETATKPEGK